MTIAENYRVGGHIRELANVLRKWQSERSLSYCVFFYFQNDQNVQLDCSALPSFSGAAEQQLEPDMTSK